MGQCLALKEKFEEDELIEAVERDELLDPVFMETPTKEEIKTILRVHCNLNMV